VLIILGVEDSSLITFAPPKPKHQSPTTIIAHLLVAHEPNNPSKTIVEYHSLTTTAYH